MALIRVLDQYIGLSLWMIDDGVAVPWVFDYIVLQGRPRFALYRGIKTSFLVFQFFFPFELISSLGFHPLGLKGIMLSADHIYPSAYML
jgi:hypothetical protein